MQGINAKAAFHKRVGMRRELLAFAVLSLLLAAPKLAPGAEPTVQVSNVLWGLRPAEGELTVSWTPGNGDGSIVLMKEKLPVDSDPVDGTEYTANSQFGLGSEIGLGNYVVYVGTGSQVTVTGLSSDLPYYVAVYAYAGAGPSIDYRQTDPARGNSGHNAAHGLLNCSDCHFGTGNFHGTFQVPTGADQATKCKTCHSPGQQATAKSAVDLHKGPTYNTLVDCGSCHEVHNQFDFVTANTHTGGISDSNVEWIRPDTTKYVAPALEPALFQANTGFFAWDDDNSPWNGICQTCHTQTDRHRNNNIPVNPHSHEVASACTGCHTHGGDALTDQDGFVPQGASCVDCHRKLQGARRQITWSGTLDGNNEPIADGEFSARYDSTVTLTSGRTSHHVNQGRALTMSDGGYLSGFVLEATSYKPLVTKWDCVVCHAEGNVDTGAPDDTYHKKDGVQLKNVDTGAVYSNWADLTPAQRSEFCLSCHDSDGSTLVSSRPGSAPPDDPDVDDYTTDGQNPFKDNVTNAHEQDGFDGTLAPHIRYGTLSRASTPTVLDVTSQFATGNTSHHAVLGAAYGSAAPFGSNVDNAIQGVRTDLAWNSVINCEDCHYGDPAGNKLSGHGTAFARYMLRDKDGNDTYPTPESAGNLSVICFRCHIPTGDPGSYDNTWSTFQYHDRGAHIDDTINIYGISCLNCHGGGEWGGIHGVDLLVTDDDGGGSYNPNVFTYGSGLDLISNWTSWENRGVSCSTLNNSALLNDCTQHSSQNYTRGQARTYRNP